MQLADLPSRRNEAWKWSDLRVAMAADEALLADAGEPAMAGPIAGLAEVLGKSASPQHLVVEGKSEPIELHQSEGEPGQLRRVTVRKGAHAFLVDRLHVIGAPTSVGTIIASYADIDVEADAEVTRIVVQTNTAPDSASNRPIVLNEVAVHLGARAKYRQFVFGEGARLARIETTIAMAGEGAEIELNGVYLASAKRHVDLTSRVSLRAPGGLARQLVRGVARKGGRGVFQGKFLVDRAAQKTDAQMAHNALLLEEGAEVFAKPELEIYADDVACAHGNTAGQLNEDAIFYLRQRGIPDTEARAMITRAFLIETLPEWIDGGQRAEIEARIDRWLGAGS